MVNNKRILSALNILRFAAGLGIISAAVTGAVGLDDSHQITVSSLAFGGALLAKISHLA